MGRRRSRPVRGSCPAAEPWAVAPEVVRAVVREDVLGATWPLDEPLVEPLELPDELPLEPELPEPPPPLLPLPASGSTYCSSPAPPCASTVAGVAARATTRAARTAVRRRGGVVMPRESTLTPCLSRRHLPWRAACPTAESARS